ncbi:hypothetical protein N7495_007145 [Penicillium taxi]|uniref:uncharacterized protein n=1 Tax=Penicillium taxi TaxID=168475 RepID=UPI002545B0BD|nr:uncharacterized protein N7495_007145 [Penicillium taxi]KAJ5895454.1 hypothetical protein N7495_007145 [Penicillium taxi]
MGRTMNDDVESNTENAPSSWRGLTTVFTWTVLCYVCIILTVIGILNPYLLPFDLLSLVVFNKDISPFFAFSHGSGLFPKPHGFKIVALVPFNYHERTAILDCYLQKNLVHNHGFLDQVVFIPQTTDAVSLDWLYSLVQKTPEYAISPPGHDMDWKIARDKTMYIRIDGDVVYLEDLTIPTIVKTKLDNPDSLFVSANVVNEAALASLHSHPGVALPYLPELHHVEQPSRSKSQLSQDWRASSLPPWEGPADFRVENGFKPPFQGHRWLLPIEGGSYHDPIASSVYTKTGPGLKDWTVSAQQHYSFLHHLEYKDLTRYKFPLWVNPTEPISQNFGCFWGQDSKLLRTIFEHDSIDSEELLRSWTASNGTHPNVAIDGKGLVSHYSASLGTAGLDSTDLLERYRAYAQEMVCRERI